MNLSALQFPHWKNSGNVGAPNIIQDYKHCAQTHVRSPGAQRWKEKGLALKVCHMRCVLTCSVVSDSLRLHGQKSDRLLCPWDSPGKSAAAGCHALLQGIFQTQGSNPHLQQLLHWQAGSLSLSISPVSCTAGGLLSTSTAREAHTRRGRKISVSPFLSPRGICHFKGQAARSSGP